MTRSTGETWSDRTPLKRSEKKKKTIVLWLSRHSTTHSELNARMTFMHLCFFPETPPGGTNVKLYYKRAAFSGVQTVHSHVMR